MTAEEEIAAIEQGMDNYAAQHPQRRDPECVVCRHRAAGDRCPRHDIDEGGWRPVPTAPAVDPLAAPKDAS
jgi:hypothetical protein